MAAATVLAELGTGASVSWASAEGGMKWNRVDTLAGTTPIPIPTSTGTNYSWPKSLCLNVTGAGTTSMSNRKISLATSSPDAHLNFWVKAVAVASYAQSAALTDNATTQDVAPSTWTQAISTTPYTYDSASVATSGTGPNGQMAVCVAGIGNQYGGGAGSNNSSPSLTFTYDEARYVNPFDADPMLFPGVSERF